MKTIVFKGSPNKNGYTNQLLNKVLADLEGEVVTYDAYELNVTACTDCKYCDQVLCKCKIKDEMTMVYEELVDADNIIIATPVHVASVTAPLLAIMSRFQIYFGCKFKHKQPIPLKKKRGFLIATAGSDWPGYIESVKTIVSTSFLELNTTLCSVLYQPHTDSESNNINIDDFKMKLRGVEDENIR